MSVSIGITGLAPLIGVAGVVLAACSSAADRPASRDTMAMTTAAAPDTATPTSRAAAETSGTATDSTTAIRTQRAGVTQSPASQPPVRPSIDPGRKSTTASSGKSAPRDMATSAPSDTAPPPASGDTGGSAQTSTVASGQDKYLKWDAESKTATFELQAGPFTFNGFSSGGGTLTLPPNANVVINFINKDGTPHSAEVIPGEGAIPNQAVEAAIPRAYTTKVLEGLPQEGSDNMKFTVPASGSYRIFCGVPGHGLSGMWIWMKIDPAAKTPSFGATKK